MNASIMRARKPDWLRIRVPSGATTVRLKELMRKGGLHTVCEEARCPNMAECWNAGTATFMILGDICTRSCGFCAVKTGRPVGLDLAEPRRVAEAVSQMGIRHAVVTSVNRDELADGGAAVFAATIREIRALTPGVTVEVLIPDFRGVPGTLETIIAAAPDILNHNVETVPRLYTRVRPQAKYARSLSLLRRAKKLGMVTKTGLMLGIGESIPEVHDVMGDLRGVGCDILTLGQYLQPTANHLPVDRYLSPEEFGSLRRKGLEMGFRFVESGPLVRSSYHAERHVAVDSEAGIT
jgi:lipoic acid synthetase